MGECKSKPFLVSINETIIPSHWESDMVRELKANSCYLGQRPVQWGRAALVWTYYGYTVSNCLVWLGRFWLDSLSMTLQRCLTFPHLSALWICGVVSDCVPWGLEFLEGTLGLVSLSVRETKQLDSGPPVLPQPGRFAYIV